MPHSSGRTTTVSSWTLTWGAGAAVAPRRAFLGPRWWGWWAPRAIFRQLRRDHQREGKEGGENRQHHISDPHQRGVGGVTRLPVLGWRSSVGLRARPTTVASPLRAPARTPQGSPSDGQGRRCRGARYLLDAGHLSIEPPISRSSAGSLERRSAQRTGTLRASPCCSPTPSIGWTAPRWGSERNG